MWAKARFTGDQVKPGGVGQQLVAFHGRGLRSWWETKSLAPMNFVAIDFETASNRFFDSVCAIGLVRISHGQLLEKRHHLIRPRYRRFTNTRVHGITAEQVRYAPTFEEAWPDIRPILSSADFIIAHNARFEKRVLGACSSRCGLRLPRLRFICTLKLARNRLPKLGSHALDMVCRTLGIPLEHHDALSDAVGSARIMLHARCREHYRLGLIE